MNHKLDGTSTKHYVPGSPELRELFPHTKKGLIYLDHAAVSPFALPVVDALNHHIHHRSEIEVNTYKRDLAELQQCRELVTTLINAESPDRIAFCMNTSDALNIVASGYPFQEGDCIIGNDREFPANVQPFYNLRHKAVKYIPLVTSDGVVTPEMIQAAINEYGAQTIKAVALSAVQFLSGYRADLAAIGAICRKHKILFIVDAIQALGAVPIDVQAMNIDALACGGHKWLFAPHGIGFLYVSELLQEKIQQSHVGWLSVETPWDFFKTEQNLATGAQRYETGTFNFLGIRGLRASLDLLLCIGIHTIEHHLMELTHQLYEELSPLNQYTRLIAFPRESRAGIVSAVLRQQGAGEAIFHHLLRHQVVISLREGHLRFAPHCYTSHSEITTAMEVLRSILI